MTDTVHTETMSLVRRDYQEAKDAVAKAEELLQMRNLNVMELLRDAYQMVSLMDYVTNGRGLARHADEFTGNPHDRHS